MLKLVKTTAQENYPISPQTSSIRKFTLKVQPSAAVDLSKSYLLVKNTLTTTIRGQQVTRNVGWGSSYGSCRAVQFPNTAQIRTAQLSVDGQVVEYNEDLNVRVCNMAGYLSGADSMKKWSNVGSWGFQRLEGRRIGTLDGTAPVLRDGDYMSPFVVRPVTAANTMGAASYQELPSVIYMSDLFEFCRSAGQVNLAGRQISIELQFEDRFDILTEILNYPADTTAAAPVTRSGEVLAVDPASVRNADGTNPPTSGNANGFYILTTQAYRTISDVPLYVGQPIALWLTGAAPAVAGSNYAVITGLKLVAGNVCQITFNVYAVGRRIWTANNTTVTDAQFFANIYAGGAGVCVGITGIDDPLQVAAAADSLEYSGSAGKYTQYALTGLEAVMCEISKDIPKKQIEYIQYMRDLDTVPQNQLNYQKSFQLDPMTVSVFAMAPPVKAAGAGQTNLYSVHPITAISTGLSMRNMLNGMQLYNRDITFSDNISNVEPLQLDRVEMALDAVDEEYKNKSGAALVVQDKDGKMQHVMVAEAVTPSEAVQQLQVRLNYATNAEPRTIYVFKAVQKSISV